MIMTVLPRNVFCPHTLPVEELAGNFFDSTIRLVYCAMMNSVIVDSWLRKSITNHLSFFFLYQTPIPRLKLGDPFFHSIVRRAAQLIFTTPEFE